MMTAPVKGKKRRRTNEPFTMQSGITLLTQAGSTTVISLFKAATRSFEHSLEHQQPSLLPPQLISHSSTDGGTQRRNAGEVDEEDWHGEQASGEDGRHATSSDRHDTRRTENNHNRTTISRPSSTKTATTATLGSSQQSPPRVKLEPASSMSSSKLLGSSVRRSGASQTKKRVVAKQADSTDTEDEKCATPPSARSKRATRGTPAFKRSLYVTAD